MNTRRYYAARRIMQDANARVGRMSEELELEHFATRDADARPSDMRGDITSTPPKPSYTARKSSGKPATAEIDSRWDADAGLGASRPIKPGTEQLAGYTARKASPGAKQLRA
jgi:hypothetical protein